MENMQSIDLNDIGSDAEPFSRYIEHFSLNHSGTDGRVLAVKYSKLDSGYDWRPDMFSTFFRLPELFKDLEHEITPSRSHSKGMNPFTKRFLQNLLGWKQYMKDR